MGMHRKQEQIETKVNLLLPHCRNHFLHFYKETSFIYFDKQERETKMNVTWWEHGIEQLTVVADWKKMSEMDPVAIKCVEIPTRASL